MQAEKDPADVGRSSKIHLIAVLRILSFFYHRVTYYGLCQVVGNQLCPDLLLYKFNLIGMEATQTDRVLELTEGGLNPPPGKIKAFNGLRRELVHWKIRHDAFVRAVIQWKSHDPDRNGIGIQGTIWYKIKGGGCANKGDIVTGCVDLSGMGTPDDDIKAKVKGPFFRDGQVSGRAADIHVFGAEEEKLLFFQDMCHVIIRAVAAVSYKNIGSPVRCFQTVHHSAESPEFIFKMNRLDKGVLIGMGIKVIEGIEVETVETFSGMALRNKIFIRSPLGSTEKRESGTVSRQKPVGRMGFQVGKRGVELTEDFFQGLWPELIALLVQGRQGRGIRA